MSDQNPNPAWEALNFLLMDYLNRQLPDDPAANYIRSVCDRYTKKTAAQSEAPAPVSLPEATTPESPPAPPRQNGVTRKAGTSLSRSEAVKAGWARRKAKMNGKEMATMMDADNA